MSGFFNLIIGVCAFTHLFYKAECTVTVSEEGGKFLCGHTTKLKCVISPYGGGMTWKLDGTIIAQCAFGSCNPLGALPAGDVFTYDESSGEFFLDIGITHADNGTMYQCDDGSNQHQITVNIAVPPHTGTPITVSGTTLSATAGCFYPANDGKMDIYCVTDGRNDSINTNVPMTSIGTRCSGDCDGPGIFQATGTATIDNSTGTSAYLVRAYLKDFPDDFYEFTATSAIYDCDNSTTTTSTPTTTTTTSPTTTSTTSTTTTTTTTSPTTTSTTSTPTTTTTTSPTTTSTTSTTNTTTTTSPTTTSTSSTTTNTTTTTTLKNGTAVGEPWDNTTTVAVTTSIFGACVLLVGVVAMVAFLYRRVRSNHISTKASGDNHFSKSDRKTKSPKRDHYHYQVSDFNHRHTVGYYSYPSTAGNHIYSYTTFGSGYPYTAPYYIYPNSTYDTQPSVKPHSKRRLNEIHYGARNVRIPRSAHYTANYQRDVLY